MEALGFRVIKCKTHLREERSASQLTAGGDATSAGAWTRCCWSMVMRVLLLRPCLAAGASARLATGALLTH